MLQKEASIDPQVDTSSSRSTMKSCQVEDASNLLCFDLIFVFLPSLACDVA